MKRNVIKRSGWQWAPVPSKLITSDKLDGNAVRLYSYLLWRAGSDMTSWPGVETMAQDCHISERETRRALASLIKDNWIHRQRRMSSSSITYVFERQSECIEFRNQAAGGLSDRPPEAQVTGRPRPEELEPKEQEPKRTRKTKEDDEERAPKFSKPFLEYERNIGALVPILKEELDKLILETSESAVLHGITQAVGSNARNLRYIAACARALHSGADVSGGRTNTRRAKTVNQRMTVAQQELQRIQNGESENDILGIFGNL